MAEFDCLCGTHVEMGDNQSVFIRYGYSGEIVTVTPMCGVCSARVSRVLASIIWKGAE